MADAVALVDQVEQLLTASEEGEGFSRRYFEALQRQPAVVLAHADVRRATQGHAVTVAARSRCTLISSTSCGRRASAALRTLCPLGVDARGDARGAGRALPAASSIARSSKGRSSHAVWKIAWPTVLQNAIGGLQGIIDHAMVGHYVGFTGNAAIGVSWQIFLVVIVFIASLFTGMGVLVARFAGANEPEKVNRTVYQAFLTAVVLSLLVLAPLGYVLSPTLLDLVQRHTRGQGRGAAVPADDVRASASGC